MNREELLRLLQLHQQEHIVTYYDKLNQDDRETLIRQIEHIDWSLFEKVKNGVTLDHKGTIEPINVLEIAEIASNKVDYTNVGIEEIQQGKLGVVLLAGGQGTRLGYDGPKGTVNIGLTKELYIFEMLFRNTMEVVNQTGTWIPFYIMTSNINHDTTVKFLEEHNYFGYAKEYINFFIQEMTPSVDFNGKLYMEEMNQISLSPNGNGGWFNSMIKTGVIEDVRKRKLEWINVFAVDNVLQRIADPAFLGATIKSGCVSGAKVVKKADPHERVGVLCLEDGRPSIVEYYEMTDEMVHAKNERGEYSYNFGVILNYLFKITSLEKIIEKNLPVHIVEKKINYITAEGTYVKAEKPNGYKFEELVLDMIHMLDNCLPYEVERKKEFAPIKNKEGVDSIDSARLLLQENGVEL